MRKEVWKMKRTTKNKMLRSACILSLCAALGLSLAGCGGKENDGSNLPGIHGVELQDGSKAEGIALYQESLCPHGGKAGEIGNNMETIRKQSGDTIQISTGVIRPLCRQTWVYNKESK